MIDELQRMQTKKIHRVLPTLHETAMHAVHQESLETLPGKTNDMEMTNVS